MGRLNLVTAFGYDDVGNNTSITDPNGNETTFQFDAERRKIQQTDPTPFSFITSWEYDANGWQTVLTKETGDPANPLQVWTNIYQENGSLKKTIDPSGFDTVFEYNTNNWLIKRVDAEGRTWQYQHDALGRVLLVIDPLGNASETRAYTENGALASIEDARHNKTNYEYDGFDRLKKRIYPDQAFEEYEYDDNNNVLTLQTRNEDEIVNTYDVLNRLSTRQPGALPLQTLTYDLAGRQLSISTPPVMGDPGSGEFSFGYDTAGRLNLQEMPDSKTVGYQLDANGNRTRLIYPDGYYADYVFDELNRLTDIKLNGASTAAVHFEYDDLSRRVLVTYENGSQCAYAYSIGNDLTALAHTFTGSSVGFEFSYNKLHQVKGMASSNSQYVWTPAMSRSTVYSSANNLNQYPAVAGAALTYNENGCQTGGSISGSALAASYDELNRITQASLGAVTNEYLWDPLNRQAQKELDSVKTGFIYDGQQLIEEYDNEGDLANRYVRGNRLDEIYIKIAASGGTKTYLHHDRLGSVIALTDEAGAVVESCAYGPFGETPSALAASTFAYTGQRYDQEIELYNYKARYYSPTLGRFLQPDPIGFDAGDLNLYSYVGNDGVNLVDSLGLEAGVGGDYQTRGSQLGYGESNRQTARDKAFREVAPSASIAPHEYSSTLYYDPKDNRYHWTEWTKGDGGSAPRTPPPPGTILAQYMHTHPVDVNQQFMQSSIHNAGGASTSATGRVVGAGAGLLEGEGGNQLSVRDITSAHRGMVRTSVLVPGGQVWEYDPRSSMGQQQVYQVPDQ